MKKSGSSTILAVLNVRIEGFLGPKNNFMPKS